MTKKNKLLVRLLGKPKDFTYSELISLLSYLGYHEIRSGHIAGSRVAFYHPDKKHIIRMHRPHPGTTLKMYQIEMIIEALKSEGII